MPLLATPKLLRPAEILRESGFTELWRRRQMSNFEYLMRLNIIAGRSYNDINQYPVFPWVLADYDSPTLDLSNPAVRVPCVGLPSCFYLSTHTPFSHCNHRQRQ